MKNIMFFLVLLNMGISYQLVASDYQEIYQDLVRNSDNLYGFVRDLQRENNWWVSIPNHEFPTENNRMKNIVERSPDPEVTKKQIVKDAQSVKLLIHPKVKTALKDFLKFKSESGTFGERKLYRTMQLEDFVYRLIYKRPLVFTNAWDSIVLRPPHSMINSDQNIDALGGKAILAQGDSRGTTFILEAKQFYNRLIDYLSYDEIPFAALLGLSSPTYFINDGTRTNRGVVGSPESYEERGIYVGLVGPRLEKPDYMERQHMVVTQQQNTSNQNTHGNLYGKGKNTGLMKVWSTLYDGLEFLTYDEVKQEVSKGNPRFTVVQRNNTQFTDAYFDIAVYKKRMSIIIEGFLLEANNSALQAGTQADVFVVGLGLGAWQFDDRQALWMVQVYQNLINSLSLPNIARINFSYVTNPYFTPKDADYMINGIEKNTHISVVFTTDNPADPLPADKKNHLRFAMYAWDGNAYPGNEYWTGSLAASGDPAAACCSTIPEIQNTLINPFIKESIKTALLQTEFEQQKQHDLMIRQQAMQQARAAQPTSPVPAINQPQSQRLPSTTPQPQAFVPQKQDNPSNQKPWNQRQPQNPNPGGRGSRNRAPQLIPATQQTPTNQTANQPPSGSGPWKQFTAALSSLASTLSSGASAALSGIWNGFLRLLGRT